MLITGVNKGLWVSFIMMWIKTKTGSIISNWLSISHVSSWNISSHLLFIHKNVWLQLTVCAAKLNCHLFCSQYVFTFLSSPINHKNHRLDTNQRHVHNTDNERHRQRGNDPPRLVGRCVLKSRSGDTGGGWLEAAGNPKGYLHSRSVGLKGSDSGRRSIAVTGGRERGNSFIIRSAGWHAQLPLSGRGLHHSNCKIRTWSWLP
jgi:hypothetical protein